MISPKGSIYRLKRIGPRIDPCGTPEETGATEEETLQPRNEDVMIHRIKGSGEIQ